MGLHPKISIVIPVYNEEEVLTRQLDFILRSVREITRDFEVVVVENGSKDNTKSVLLRYSQSVPEIKPLTHENPDYGGAMRKGIIHASGEIIHICQIDFFDADFFKLSLEKLEAGKTFILGSRNRRGWDNRPIQRKILTFGLNYILRWFFDFKGTDTHGLKTFVRKRIIDYAQACKMRKGVFDTEMVLRAQYDGIEIVEIPVMAYEMRKKRNTYFVKIFRNIKDLIILKYHLRNK